MSFDIIIGWAPYKTKFRGHEIQMQLRPLKRWASILLTPIFLKTAEKVKRKKAEEKQAKLRKEKKIFHNSENGLPANPRTEEGDVSEAKELTKDDIDFAYEVQEVAEKVFPDHLKDIIGLTVNGSAITIKDICQETVFAPIAMDIIGELAKRSQLPEDEAKNSGGPSPMPTSAENTQVN